MENLGKLLVFTGIIIVIIGLVLWLAGSRLSWFGNLPGDVKILRENVRIYIPFMSMILVSIFLSLLIWLFQKIFK